MTDHTKRILTLNDAGHTPAQIAAALPNVKLGAIYATLRAHRPKRPRAPRRRTSHLPATVLGLHGAGLKVTRIADLLKVTRAYVYQILADQR